MDIDQAINWFKETAAPFLKHYEVKEQFFPEGDFGSLKRIEFNNSEEGGSVDFWSKNYVALHYVSYVTGKEIVNKMITPEEFETLRDELGIFITLL